MIRNYLPKCPKCGCDLKWHVCADKSCEIAYDCTNSDCGGQYKPVTDVKEGVENHLSEERSYEEQKADLEAKIKALNEERTALHMEIPALEKRGTILNLGDRAKTLQDEVLALRAKKSELLNEIAKYSDVVTETET